MSDETGTGSLVFATSPTLVTPILGVATATSINGATISTTTGTITLANGSTLATSGANSITLTSTGATNVTLPTTGTVATLAGAEAFTNKTFTSSTNVLGGVTMTLGSDANGDMYFRQGGVLTRIALGAAGSFLKSAGGIPTSAAPYSVSSQSVDYTLVLADASSVLYLTGSTAKSFTIPPNSSVAFAVGTVITFYQDGTGALTLVAGSGVTIRSEYGLILNTQYSVATITKIASDTWILGGSLRVS
jgi:hypothetical protein